MSTDVCEKYNHYKPPYNYKHMHSCVDTRKCVSARDVNLKPCPAPQEPGKCVCERKQEQVCDCRCAQQNCPGLLQYRSWWERINVDLAVNGDHINGTPIFVKQDTLRVINDDHSYFIPLEKVDYIRTNDGLRSGFHLPND